jgi:glycosyltransferase involved in cell wall biosynthesis
MNILYVTQFFSATMGGAELVFYNWAEEMVRRGHHVDVLCHQITNFREKELISVNVHRIRPVVEHKGELPPSILQNMRYITNALLKGSQIIRQNKIDIVHTSFFTPVIVGSILGKIHSIPVVSTIFDVFTTASRDYWKKWATQNHLSRISSVIGPYFEKITVKMPTNAILTLSNTSKEDLIKFNVRSDKIVVIPHGIDTASYDTLGSVTAYENYVIFIGRLVFYKNLEVIVNAFKDVTKKLPDARFIIVGSGPMRAQWEKLVSDLGLDKNIIFMGYVSQAKKIDLLGKCSALLLPSLFEGFGLVLLEAFAMRKPVLVAKVKPYDEIVDEGIDGYMVSPYDAKSWSEKIIFLLSNKTICQEMGIKGRRKVESKYNIVTISDQIESLYFDLYSKKSTREELQLSKYYKIV